MSRLTRKFGDEVILPIIPMDINSKEDLEKYHNIRREYENMVIKLSEYEDREEINNCKYFDNLNKEDIELIKSAMLQNAVTLTSEALECKDVMPIEVYEKDMANSDRLIYLVNVLNDVSEYDR